MILNKTDHLPYVDFDMARAIANAVEVNPTITTIQLSTRTGEGPDAWYDWLRHQAAAVRDMAFS